MRLKVLVLVFLSSIADPSTIRGISITEVFYNPGPLDPGGAALEFVEIFNDSSVVVDLSRSYFSRGIQFSFPDEYFLKARSHVAICADAERVKERYGPDVNVLGDFEGRLDDGGETLRLVTATGSLLAEVSYEDRGEWPAAADGTGFSLSLRNPFADARDPASWTRSSLPGGTPGIENFPPPFFVDRPMFPESGAEAVWRYKPGWNAISAQMEAFSDPPSAWREPGFDDASWTEGTTPIGFGETEMVTLLDDMQGSYVSFAARKRIHLTEAQIEDLEGLVLTVRYDDACVAYFDGEEVGRGGFTAAVGTEVAFDATASIGREMTSSRPLIVSIPKEKITEGEHLLAIQVHNQSLNSNDAGFAASLAYRTIVTFPPAPVPTVVFNELVTRARARAVELYNLSSASVELGGYRISRDPVMAEFHTLPQGARIDAKGFLSVSEADLGFSLEGEHVAVFLFSPDGQSVLDAASVEDPILLPATDQSHARLPDGGGPWWISTRPTPGTKNEVEVETSLVLNEIHYNPKLVDESSRPLSDTVRGEFIEIFNKSDRAVSMNGLRLAGGVRYAFEPDAVLPAQGYLVVARDPAYIRETYKLPADQVVGLSETATPDEVASFGSLGNRGETIRLEDSLGNPVDEVSYRDEGEWDALADGEGSSLELVDPRQDNSSPHAWQASDESQKAPWTEIALDVNHVANLAPLPMESELHIFLISEGECLLDGISLTSGEPPVEYIPNGDFETNTSSWRLTGTHVRSSRTTAESKVGNACLHLVATGSGDNRVNRIEVDTSPQLRQGKLRLKMWARWLRGSNALHVSGYNNAFGNTVFLPVPRDAGSPGRENVVRTRLRVETGSDNQGPVISKVRHEPAVPGRDVPLDIMARVTDSDGVASAEVAYQKDGTATAERSPLFDDGLHGDGDAGDGNYAGEIPALPVKTLVNFWIEAKDSAGATSIFPRGAPEKTLLYIVDDPLESSVYRYRLLINRKNLTAPVTGLATRLLHSDELVPATFIFDESETFYDVGVRYHGSPWNRPPDPKMFRVRFNGDKLFRGGAKRINISRYGVAQNEGSAYHLIHKASVPDAVAPHSPRYEYMTMRLNGTPHGSVLADIRPIDDEYVEYNWPNDSEGYAWKITGKLAFNDSGTMAVDPDWTQLKAYSTGPYPGTHSPENYRFYFNPTLRIDEDVFDPLILLLKTMDRTTTPDAEYDAKLEQILNVEASLRVYAVRALLADWDTIGIGNGQNAYIYYAPIEGRHYLVPWDMDHTCEQTGVAIAPGSTSNGIGRILSRPSYRRLYARILKEQLDSTWSDQHINQWFQLVAETTTPAHVAAGTVVANFIRSRRSTVSSYIRSGTGMAFAITTPDPKAVAATSVRIQGTAPIDVASLYTSLNHGSPAESEPIWTVQGGAIPTVWQIDVNDLTPGKNTLEVLAFTGGGDLLGSDTIALYNTTGWLPPTVESVRPQSGPIEGGTEIVIGGKSFRESTKVELGTAAALDVAFVSEGEIRARTPPGSEGFADVIVTNVDGQTGTLPQAFLYTTRVPGPFIRGEVDGVAGIDATDALRILLSLFRGESLSCDDAADVNDDGKLNVSDAVCLLLYLFGGHAPPPEPFDAAGSDPTADSLGCAAF